MKTLKNNPLSMICLVAFLCAAALIAFVTVYAAPVPGKIQACYDNTNGNLRRVKSASDCRDHETPISWSVAGPTGPQGAGGTSMATRHSGNVRLPMPRDKHIDCQVHAHISPPLPSIQ